MALGAKPLEALMEIGHSSTLKSTFPGTLSTGTHFCPEFSKFEDFCDILKGTIRIIRGGGAFANSATLVTTALQVSLKERPKKIKESTKKKANKNKTRWTHGELKL